MADAVEAALELCPWLDVERVDDNVVARTDLGRDRRVLLAGHLDTVPPAEGNDEPRVEGDTLHGLGRRRHEGRAGRLPAPGREPRRPAGGRHVVLLRGRGGGPASTTGSSGCGTSARTCWPPTSPSWASRPAGLVEAGCQGTMRVRVTLAGLPCPHGPALRRSERHPPAGPSADGDRRLRGPPPGHRRLRVRRAAPGRVRRGRRGRQRRARTGPPSCSTTGSPRTAPPAQAESAVRELLAPHLEPGDHWELVEAAAGAPPSLDHPVLAALVAASGAPPRAKVGWTDVAFFADGACRPPTSVPGDPLLAHTPGEHVSAHELAGRGRGARAC